MIMSGQNSRSISLQSEGVVDLRFNFADKIGNFEIGLSGDSFLGLKCENSLISINGDVINSVENDSNNYALFFDQDSIKINKNNITLLGPVSHPSGVYDTLLVNSTEPMDVDITISGKRPNLEFSILNNAPSGGGVVSGYFNNLSPDRTFRFFNCEVDSNHSAKFVVSGWESGVCSTGCVVQIYSLENEPIPTSGVKLNINSNYGLFSVITNIGSDFSGTTEFFEISPNQNVFINKVGSRRFDITSFFSGPERPLYVELEYISGGLTAQLPELLTGNISGNVNGFIKGCGSASNVITDYLYGVVGQSGFIFSGNATGVASGNWCHTGVANWSGTVLHSGVVPSGVKSGEIYYQSLPISLSGDVLGGSGYYDFSETTTSGVSVSGADFTITGQIDEIVYLYYTEGRIFGTVSSGVNLSVNKEICGPYNGPTLITVSENYHYDYDGWSGLIPVGFSGYYIPTGPYSGTTSGIGTGVAPNSSPISGLISGGFTGLITESSNTLTGTISGLIPYTGIECVKSGDRLVGNVSMSTEELFNSDPYFPMMTGRLLKFQFSNVRDYLLGSGLACKVYLSGYVYNLSAPSAFNINQFTFEIRDRTNQNLLESVTIDSYVRDELGPDPYSPTFFPVNRKEVVALTGFDFTGEINIIGKYVTSDTSTDYNNENCNLTLVPFMPQEVTGLTSVYYDYEEVCLLTGSGCVQGSGVASGEVFAFSTEIPGSGIGSGILLGPKVPIDFKNMWSLYSGVGGSRHSFYDSGWYTGGVSGKYVNSGGPMITRQNIFNTPYVEINYIGAGNTEASVMKLSVFDDFNIREVLISGL